MKRIIKYIWILALLLANSACEEKSFLKELDPNRSIEANFWKSESDVNSAMATIYSPLRLPLYGFYGAFEGFQDINAIGDDIFTIPGEEAATWGIATFTNDENNGDARSIFTLLYKSIYRANQFLDNVDKVEMDAAKKETLKAEAKFLRGMSYFLLASNWGSVPIRTSSAIITSDANLENSPVAAVWKQVVDDLTAAKAKLPVTRDAKELGRATSGAAIAFLGKSYLFMEDYAKAKAEFDLLSQAPYNYGLVDNYEDNFTDANEFNKESIFEWNCAAFGDQYGPWGSESANSPMYNYIPQLIGPAGGGGWFKYVPSNYIIKEFVKEKRVDGSDTKFDKRMYASLFWKHSTFGEPDVTWYGGSIGFDGLWKSCKAKISRLYPETPFDTITNGRFLIRKFTSSWRNEAGADNYWGPKPSVANYRIMRFAEVLLMRAEANAQTNDNAKAIADINTIRLRAGLSAKTAAELSDNAKIMAEIDHQKTLELFFEQNRVYDLRRWNKDAGQLKTVLLTHGKQGADKFGAKHYFFPIPATEMETNTKAVQNPLWK